MKRFTSVMRYANGNLLGISRAANREAGARLSEMRGGDIDSFSKCRSRSEIREGDVLSYCRPVHGLISELI